MLINARTPDGGQVAINPNSVNCIVNQDDRIQVHLDCGTILELEMPVAGWETAVETLNKALRRF